MNTLVVFKGFANNTNWVMIAIQRIHSLIIGSINRSHGFSIYFYGIPLKTHDKEGKGRLRPAICWRQHNNEQGRYKEGVIMGRNPLSVFSWR